MRAMSERPQSLGGEIANSVSHGLALVAAIDRRAPKRTPV
jgi:hypothetical protein